MDDGWMMKNTIVCRILFMDDGWMMNTRSYSFYR